MRIEPHANLTITLLERHLFGSDRLAGSMPRCAVPVADRVVETACRPCDEVEVHVDRCEPDFATPAVGIVIPGDEAAAPGDAPHSPESAGGGAAGAGAGTVGNLLDVMA